MKSSTSNFATPGEQIKHRASEWVKRFPPGSKVLSPIGDARCGHAILSFIYFGFFNVQDGIKVISMHEELHEDRDELDFAYEMAKNIEGLKTLKTTEIENPEPGTLYYAHIGVHADAFTVSYTEVPSKTNITVGRIPEKGLDDFDILCLYSVETGFVIFGHEISSVEEKYITERTFLTAEV